MSLVLVEVPPQPEELKAFLVSGAVVHGRVEGAFISIVRRRGEHSLAISPAGIHAAVPAGPLLRGEESRELSDSGGSGNTQSGDQ